MPSPTMSQRTPAGDARLAALVRALSDPPVAFRQGMMFGCPGLRNPSGKFFVTQWGDDLVFKLAGDAHAQALGLPGAHVFEPMPGRPMKQWVSVPRSARADDERLARAAVETLG